MSDNFPLSGIIPKQALAELFPVTLGQSATLGRLHPLAVPALRRQRINLM